jgi:hypothetical protein
MSASAAAQAAMGFYQWVFRFKTGDAGPTRIWPPCHGTLYLEQPRWRHHTEHRLADLQTNWFFNFNKNFNNKNVQHEKNLWPMGTCFTAYGKFSLLRQTKYLYMTSITFTQFVEIILKDKMFT